MGAFEQELSEEFWSRIKQPFTRSELDEIHLEEGHEFGPGAGLIRVALEAVGQKSQSLMSARNEVPQSDGDASDIETTILVTLTVCVADLDSIEKDRTKEYMRSSLPQYARVVVSSGGKDLTFDKAVFKHKFSPVHCPSHRQEKFPWRIDEK